MQKASREYIILQHRKLSLLNRTEFFQALDIGPSLLPRGATPPTWLPLLTVSSLPPVYGPPDAHRPRRGSVTQGKPCRTGDNNPYICDNEEMPHNTYPPVTRTSISIMYRSMITHFRNDLVYEDPSFDVCHAGRRKEQRRGGE